MLNVYKLLLELSVFLFSLLVYMMLFFFFLMLSMVLDFENRFLRQFMQGKFLLIIVT